MATSSLSDIYGKSFFGRWFVLFALCLVAVLGAVTYYFFLTLDMSQSAQPSKAINTILVVDSAVLLVLSGIIIFRIIQVWLRFRRKVSEARLHFKIMLLFGIVSIVPAIVMMAFSTLFFHYGMQSWFNDKVQGALNESLSVARSYLKEHEQIMERDTLILAKDLSNNPDVFELPKAERNHRFNFMASTIRGMREAVVFNQENKIIARSDLTFAIGFEYIPQKIFDQVKNASPETRVVILRSESDDRLRALVKINTPEPLYLYVGRFVDPKVLTFLHEAEHNVEDYGKLAVSRLQFEVTFTLVFVVVSLLVLLTAILFGLRFANRLLLPLEELSMAAQRMASGDLTARVEENKKGDEINALKRTFNKMASQIENQRHDLLSVNEELIDRRHFIESVLSNISSAVINVNAKKQILFANESSKKIFNKDLTKSLGQSLVKVAPFFRDILTGEKPPLKSLHRKVLIEGKEHILSIKILEDIEEGHIEGYFITVEDVTELLSVQKKAAWADVARQIAHEIKNPLTPIQLATERLKKKFIGQIDSGKEQFSDYIETIMRYVQQIQSLINAFSDFARMPTPKMEKVDFFSLVHKALSLQKTAYPSIEFKEEKQDEQAVFIFVDSNLIVQALTNILKNAIEAVMDQKNPMITVSSWVEDKQCIVRVSDNGPGFPENIDAEDLFDPYITYSKEGTGLGLGIVRNIIENHNGQVRLVQKKGKGAVVEIVLPILDKKS